MSEEGKKGHGNLTLYIIISIVLAIATALILPQVMGEESESTTLSIFEGIGIGGEVFLRALMMMVDGLSQVEAELTSTVATMAFLVSNADAGEALVNRMLNALFEERKNGSIATRLNLLSRTAASQHPIDFHPAALKFFDEAEQ